MSSNLIHSTFINLKLLILAIYDSLLTLEDNILKEGDILFFPTEATILMFTVGKACLLGYPQDVKCLFDFIERDPEDFCNECYNYTSLPDIFPRCHNRDFKSLTSLVISLFDECELKLY